MDNQPNWWIFAYFSALLTMGLIMPSVAKWNQMSVKYQYFGHAVCQSLKKSSNQSLIKTSWKVSAQTAKF